MNILKDKDGQEYIQLEYIENNENAYIDTLIKPVDDMSIEVVFDNWSNSDSSLFGSEVRTSRGRLFSCIPYLVDNTIHTYVGSSGGLITTKLSKGKHKLLYIINQGRIMMILDDKPQMNQPIVYKDTVENGRSITLFNNNGMNQYALAQIYSFKIAVGRHLACKYYPAIHVKTGTVGMLDGISRQFLPSPNGVEFKPSKDPVRKLTIDGNYIKWKNNK